VKDGQTILLVDDNEDVIATVKAVAVKERLRLITAEDGQEGIDIANQELPDLILIRGNAKVLDAMSMSILLKQSEETKNIPVMVLCSDLSAQERERFQDAGCCGCIKEPLTERHLIKIIEEWLP